MAIIAENACETRRGVEVGVSHRSVIDESWWRIPLVSGDSPGKAVLPNARIR